MTEAIERNDNEYAKWIAGQSFESCANTVPLDHMPNNDDSAERGIAAGMWMRACGVILQDDDKHWQSRTAESAPRRRFVCRYRFLVAAPLLRGPPSLNGRYCDLCGFSNALFIREILFRR